MEKDRSFKIIAIVALCVGMIGLGLGFANYSSLLTISSGAEVGTSGGNFSVVFSSAENSLSTNDVEAQRSATTFTANNATIKNDDTTGPTISGLGATFTQPGQHVTYTFYARNEGEYTAFLNEITVAAGKTCTAKEGTSEEVKNKLCNGMSLEVKIADATVETDNAVSGHSLAVGEDEKIEVKISYNPTEALVGDISVTFDDITLKYGGVD